MLGPRGMAGRVPGFPEVWTVSMERGFGHERGVWPGRRAGRGG